MKNKISAILLVSIFLNIASAQEVVLGTSCEGKYKQAISELEKKQGDSVVSGFATFVGVLGASALAVGTGYGVEAIGNANNNKGVSDVGRGIRNIGFVVGGIDLALGFMAASSSGGCGYLCEQQFSYQRVLNLKKAIDNGNEGAKDLEFYKDVFRLNPHATYQMTMEAFVERFNLGALCITSPLSYESVVRDIARNVQ